MPDRTNRKPILLSDAELALIAAAAAETHRTRSGRSNIARAIREAALEGAVEHLKRGVVEADSLDALLAALHRWEALVAPALESDIYKHATEQFITDLPTFGGTDAADDEVWSWDESRVLVGTCIDDMQIEARADASSSSHIVIPQYTESGQELDPAIWPVDTDQEIFDAQEAMREAGVDQAEVWAGEAPNSVRTGMVLFATERGEA